MDLFLDTIEKKMNKIAFKQRILFTVLTCEKMFPNYLYFSEKEQWGHPDVLEEVIVIMYQILQGTKVPKKELEALYDSINEYAPDTNAFGGTASYALDACSAIGETLEHVLTKEIENAVNVASYARDTVDMFVQEKENFNSNDPELEKKIASNIYMRREIERQKTILDSLQKTSEINLSVISALRTLNDKSGPLVDISLIY